MIVSFLAVLIHLLGNIFPIDFLSLGKEGEGLQDGRHELFPCLREVQVISGLEFGVSVLGDLLRYIEVVFVSFCRFFFGGVVDFFFGGGVCFFLFDFGSLKFFVVLSNWGAFQDGRLFYFPEARTGKCAGSTVRCCGFRSEDVGMKDGIKK